MDLSLFILAIYLLWSQWTRGLRRRSAAARLLRSWVRIPPGAWMFVGCECCVLSGRGLCDELITRPGESYRLARRMWSRSLKNGEAMTRVGSQRHRKKNMLWGNCLIPEMTSIHVNNTTKKTPCHPQSMHSLGMLIAENAPLPQLRDFTPRTRCKWDLRSFGILRSVDW